ncbi:MAG TPA: hypothetical protein ENH46_02530 [Candidatus Pacearchaeota archaeon]|nr:hypothetical protein [Candidatus Pacearchaeota archaeon]
MSEYEKDYETERSNYYYNIKNVTDKNCWDDSSCEQVCDDKEKCYTPDCTPECHDEETCEEICEEFFNQETNQTEQNCTDECSIEEICGGCEGIEEICETYTDCHEECSGDEKCDEFINGEIKFEGECKDGGSNFWINAWGDGLDYYNELNEGEDWNCEPEIQRLVSVRKAIQKDMDNEFAIWFFEDFMGGDDYDKIINGEHGFRGVLDILIRNEEEIANNLHCSENKEWPSGFEKIDITYANNNTHVEVWEKNIPAEWMEDTKLYTTLYKYSWIPDRELLKRLIDYKLSETNTFGPSAKDIAEIKEDEGQMEVINSLSDRYGGSFDVKLELKEEQEEGFSIKKYLQINPDVIIKFSDQIEEKPDISVEVDYNTLYNFISYMSYEMEGDRIEGPHWVWIEDKEGPGKFFSVVGAVSKMWREGVTIKPRYALLKLFFNSKNIISLIRGVDSNKDYEGEKVKMSGEFIEER